MTVAIIILAAGKGTRMKSAIPKVLHTVAGKSLLAHVLEAAEGVAEQVVVVTGEGSEQVREQANKDGVQFAYQERQLGTAHAVACGLPLLGDVEKVLILYGDVPLIKNSTIKGLLDKVSTHSIGLLTAALDDPTGYGRIIRNNSGKVLAIVEEKDATEEQLAIHEVNTGVLALSRKHLGSWLPLIANNNAQAEYYLTDLVEIASREGIDIETCQPSSVYEVQGVNDRIQLASLERHYQRTLAEQLMLSGNSLADPERFDCRGSLETGVDNFIDVNCTFEGNVQLGSKIRIGPNCHLKDCVIEDHAEINANTVIEGATVCRGAVIGPFARLRPGTRLAADTRVGNFVETKNAIVGKGSKINHLSYVGDAVLGEKVNVGAGTITCNYDGVNKHRTAIGDGAFIGSNTSLVAPVVVNAGATVGAGSTITKDVAENQLAISRCRQANIDGWQRPGKKGS